MNAFERHRRADPHCTCNSCIEAHSAQLDAASADATPAEAAAILEQLHAALDAPAPLEPCPFTLTPTPAPPRPIPPQLGLFGADDSTD